MNKPYIEQDCTITHEGKSYTSGGAAVTADYIIAYPLKNGVLGDWHGRPIGTWRSVSTWRVNSWISSHMHQIEAIVNSVTYTGRGFGEGMVYRGKRKVSRYGG